MRLKRSKHTFLLGCLLALFISVQMHAGPIGAFSIQFTLTNQNADGTVNVANDGLSLMLTGGNTGSGISGDTDLTTVAANAGVVMFMFSYQSLDLPGLDSAGYLLRGTFVKLADMDGEGGTASFGVATGDSFGFRVATVDNEGEPGILTVSNFSAPGTAAPEPRTVLLTSCGIAAILAIACRARVDLRRVRILARSVGRIGTTPVDK